MRCFSHPGNIHPRARQECGTNPTTKSSQRLIFDGFAALLRTRCDQSCTPNGKIDFGRFLSCKATRINSHKHSASWSDLAPVLWRGRAAYSQCSIGSQRAPKSSFTTRSISLLQAYKNPMMGPILELVRPMHELPRHYRYHWDSGHFRHRPKVTRGSQAELTVHWEGTMVGKFHL